MMFEMGQYLESNGNEFIVCDEKVLNNKRIFLMYDKSLDTLAFYEVIASGDGYDFNKITDDKMIKQLIFDFSGYKERLNGEENTSEFTKLTIEALSNIKESVEILLKDEIDGDESNEN